MIHDKGGKTENDEISEFGQKEWLEIHTMFYLFQRCSRRNHEECKLFRDLNSSKWQLTFFSKRQVGPPPSLHTRACLIWASIYLTSTNAHKTLDSMAPKTDPKWCEIGPIRPITASYTCPPLWWLAISGSHKNHSTPSLVHQLRSYIVSTLVVWDGQQIQIEVVAIFLI